MPSSTVNGLPYPSGSTANAVPTHLSNLIAVMDTGSVLKRLTQTQINALTSGEKPAGLVVYNSTTGKLQISNGSGWDDVVTVPQWGAYTPTLTASTTNPNVGSTGTITGRWCRMGDTVLWAVDIVAGGSGISAGSGNYRVSLPATPAVGRAGTGKVSAAALLTVEVDSVGALIKDGGLVTHADGLTAAGHNAAFGGSYEAA